MKKNIFFPLAAIFLVGCQNTNSLSPAVKYSESRPLFGTIVRLDICSDAGEEIAVQKAFARAWERLEDINRRMNVSNPEGDVGRVNRSYPAPVIVGADTYGLLEDSVKISQVTGGIFDVTIYPLTELWKKAEQENRIPAKAELLQARSSVGIKNIEFLTNNRVRLLNNQTKIDLGGIACGYAADEAGEILKGNGFKNFLVDAGGELLASGLNCQGKPWQVGIRDPFDTSKVIDVIELMNRAVSTSGSYERYYEIQERRWPRIINPITGFPETAVMSATVIAPTATEADALSTALCVLGGQRGIAFIDSLGSKRAAFIVESFDDADGTAGGFLNFMGQKKGVTLHETAGYELLRAKERF
ncbi:MAG TPA: FAD:protein FMN transferase [Candidatus Omnitrophota bacterium]|nr:FAD:protein FMN transferase [Candidatus Omnitrophota bacterium]HPD85557.1 FAD:protein FMN transferase [Candidatus Omnitrophota bacterium]HRZ04403.1 FAD:protein FMN transferase [Candidatus Omnitrophota bacterium]